MSDHRIEYHRTWAAFFALAALLLVAIIGFCVVVTERGVRLGLGYNHAEMLACIQSDRPAADCRLIVYGSK